MSSNLNLPAHDLHLSKTEIVFNQENKALEITIHLFIDDLELALASEGYEDLFICTDKEHDQADELLKAFLEQNLILKVDDINRAPLFLGKEPSEDLLGAWCYMELSDISIDNSISVSLDFFNQLYDDQKNVLFLNLNRDLKEYFLLNKNDKEAQLNISQ